MESTKSSWAGWAKHIKVPSVALVRASTKDWYVDGLALLKRIKVLGPSGFGSNERPEMIKYKTLGRAHATVQIHVHCFITIMINTIMNKFSVCQDN